MIAGRSEEKLAEVKKEINSEKLYYKSFDVTEVKKHRKLIDFAEKLMGEVSGFVNSAGLVSNCFGRGYELWDITEE